jgi:hypothetical protein
LSPTEIEPPAESFLALSLDAQSEGLPLPAGVHPPRCPSRGVVSAAIPAATFRRDLASARARVLFAFCARCASIRRKAAASREGLRALSFVVQPLHFYGSKDEVELQARSEKAASVLRFSRWAAFFSFGP